MNQNQNPNQRKKKKSNPALTAAKAFSVLLILLAFLFLFVFCTFLSRTTSSNYDTLTPFPKLTFAGLLDGSYTEQLAAYFSDTVHDRDAIKDRYANIKDWFGTGEDEEHVVEREESSEEESDPFADFSLDPSMAETSSEETSNTSSEASEPAESSEETSSETSREDPHQGGEDEIEGSVLVMDIDGHTWAMEIYGGDASLRYIPKYCETLNNFAEKVAPLGTKVYSMVIPKSCAYYLQYSPKYGSQSGAVKRDLDAIAERLSDKVQSIDVYDALLKHADEHIYFRTDHHWTALGAYYAAQRLASDLGLPFKSLEDGYTENVRTGYLGTMYNYSGKSTRLRNDSEEFIWYTPKASYTATFYDQSFLNGFTHDLLWSVAEDKVSSWYLTFISGDGYSVGVQSNECHNGRKLLVVKDSYGNSMIPSLLYSFEEVYVVDARVFKVNLNTFVKDHGITDVVFTECAFSAVGGDYIKALMNLCQ